MITSSYPILRQSLRPEYAEASDDVVETVVAELYGEGVTADDAEDFLGGIGRAFGGFGRGVADVARQAAPVLGNALPGVLSGAATGAALGPWGALAGAAIGGVTSAVAGAQRPARQGQRPHGGRRTPNVAAMAGGALQGLASVPGLAGTLGRVGGLALPAAQAFARGDARGGVGQLAGAASRFAGAGGAGGQMAGLLARPEVQQAITAQLLGPYGRNQVSVGGMPVPASAVMNMLGSLFAGAAAESYGQPGEDESMPAYLASQDGRPPVDVASPDARAACLAQLFADTPRPPLQRLPRVGAGRARAYAEDDEAQFDEAFPDAYEDDESSFEAWSDEAMPLAYSLADLETEAGFDEDQDDGEDDAFYRPESCATSAFASRAQAM